jgi:DNA-binding transcriptional LysR family regulator
VDWTLLQTFLAVAKTGSFSKAARALTATQPTISRHVQQLEEQLGSKIFVRHSRGVKLTERGEQLFEQAQGVDAQIAALLRRQALAETQTAGTVRISANEPIGLYVLPEWLGVFREQYPSIQLELVIDNRASDLTHRDADLAVRMFRPEQPNLLAKRVGDVPVALYAHRDYLARHGTPEGLDDLSRHTVFGQDVDPTWLRIIHQMQLQRDYFPLRSDSLALHVQALLAGVCIAGAHVAFAQRHPELVRVLDGVPLPELEMWLVVHEELRREPTIACVFDSLHEFLSDYVGEGAG